jgi:hypothetical protein
MGYWQKILAELEPIEEKIRNTTHVLFSQEAVHIQVAKDHFSNLNHALRELMILEIQGETKPKK